MNKIGSIERRLLEAAFHAMSNAYVLWGFKVGAAVLADDGQIYEGCNVESWVSGLGICAERNAIHHAILHGNRKIKEIAVVMDVNSVKVRPCGSCVQYIYDFVENSEVKVIMAKAEQSRIDFESVEIKTVGQLFPFPYKGKNDL
jgi:cytidine deaminase